MSDLISRSELLKVLKDRATNEAIMGYMTAYDVTNSIIDEVEEQPTAYDIGKVVEELETNKQNALEVEESIKEYNVWNDAIEIVKQGCVSDDVCEWKYTKEIMDNAEFKVGCNPNALKRGVVPNNFSYHDFKYCPYCGKKIKAVE